MIANAIIAELLIEMDPISPAARNPLPQVPILTGTKIDIEATGFEHRASLDKDAVDRRGTRTRERFERIFFDMRFLRAEVSLPSGITRQSLQ